MGDNAAMLWKLCLCAAIALTGTTAASACWPSDRPHSVEDLATWKGPTTAQQFEKANAVFVARIMRTEEAQIVLAGWDYVFFLRPDVLIDNDHNLVWWTTGSFGTFNIEGTEPKGILEELRELSRSAK